jgi:hypothetical protein
MTDKPEFKEPIKHDKQKATLPSLLPVIAIQAIHKVLKFGADKYGPRNWLKGKGMPYSRLYDASERHKDAWVLGEDIDKESGLYHLAHKICSDIFLLTYCLTGMGIDDRHLIRGEKPREDEQ